MLVGLLCRGDVLGTSTSTAQTKAPPLLMQRPSRFTTLLTHRW